VDRPRSDDEDGSATLADFIADPRSADPERLAMDKALHALLVEAVMGAGLSDFEAEVLLARLRGRSYQGIADDLGRQAKAVDNALQRITSKLKPAIRAALRAFALA
jgi:RNA polymerase sporulation-specific sigma factor